MNLDELQSVQARERQSSDLQHLRASFYREVGEFISELTAERAEAVEAADDPFASPEVRRLSDDIETTEQTVEAIYERRVGKVVKKASIAAAGMPVDDDGLTDEETELFEDLVARIQRNRESVLAALDGAATSVSPDIDTPAADDGPADPPTPDTGGGPPGTDTGTASADPEGEGPAGDGAPGTDAASAGARGDEPPAEGVSAADLMADPAAEPDDTAPEDASSGSQPPSMDAGGESSAPGDGTEPSVPEPEPLGEDGDPSVASGSGDGTAAGGTVDDVPELPRTTVRITADVGEVVGADDRDYELSPEDVVTLPEPNAEVLLDKGAAERLE